MEPEVAPLAALYTLNTDLLLNCLDDLTDAEAQQRLAAGGNSVTFLASHLVDSRHFLVTRLGRPLPNPLARFLADVRSIEEIRDLPPLEDIRSAWLEVSAHLYTVLDSLTADELREPNAHKFPIGDKSRLGMITFLIQHDSYHLGQVAFLRRQLGRPPMSYAPRTRPAGSASTV
jgi:uncharacterized damage-inducible protein DinB